MTSHGISTERVREYRARQRDAGRKLVCIYLSGDIAARLAQLADWHGERNYAEELLAHAVQAAWWEKMIAGAALQTRRAVAAGDAFSLFPGRRRSFAARG